MKMTKAMKKTLRLTCLSAACLVGSTLPSDTFGQEQARISGDLQFRITDAEGKVHELPILREIVRVDARGKLQWREEAISEVTAEIRKHLKAHAPELVRGFDELVLDLAEERDPAILVARVGELLVEAEPELVDRITLLAEKIIEGAADELAKP